MTTVSSAVNMTGNIVLAVCVNGAITRRCIRLVLSGANRGLIVSSLGTIATDAGA